MFEHDAIHERGKALEDEFFHRVDEKLRQQLHDSLEREKALENVKKAEKMFQEMGLDYWVSKANHAIQTA